VTGAVSVGLREDGEGYGLRRVSAKIKADGRVQQGGALFHAAANGGGDFADEDAGAMARAKYGEIARCNGEQRREQGAVLRVAVGHENDSIAPGNVDGRDAEVIGEQKNAVSRGKAHGLGELGAAICHGNAPADLGSERGERLRIVACAKDDETLRGEDMLNIDFTADGGSWG